ncbi:MAG: hypothetical protein V4574_19590 [Pseudomonadota bacterium]
MIILPMMLMLAVQDAPDKLPEPAKADSATILYAPSRSLRSASAAAAAGLPASPVTVRLQCTVATDTGTPESCIPLDAGAKPVTSRAELARRAAAWESGAASAAPAVTVALQRVMLTRIRPTAEAGKPPVPVQMLFTETVGASDVVKLGASSGTIESRDLEMDERPDAAVLEAYYPAAALRAGIQARIRATCRVMPDRKLFCRDAELVSPDAAITPAIAAEFRNATYQVFDAVRLAPLSKKGDPVVGRDVDMRISFVLPG